MSRFERDQLIYEYNGAVDLSKHSHVPSIRENSARRAEEIAKKLGWI